MADGAVLQVTDLWQCFRRRSRHGGRIRTAGRSTARQWALRGLDLTVLPGELVGVVGPNGSGKSTLLRTVAGVYRPEKGTVRVRGRVSSLIDLDSSVHRDLTGRENLFFGAVMLGLSRHEARGRYAQIREFSGLSEATLNQPFSSYSAGMTLRLTFSVILNSDPSVLLVDEVLAVGDETFRAQCADRVDELRRTGCGVLLVSHDLDLVRSRCSRVVVFDQGKVVASGQPDEVLDTYRALAAVETEGSPDPGRLS
jgi:ABC-type polysaccharide/polyol phosphate transport system ATPase subunit